MWESNTSNPEIHLFVLEVTLPRINELDLCQLLRRKGCNLPILIISGKDSEMDRVLGLEIGADDYWVKPFGMRELIADKCPREQFSEIARYASSTDFYGLDSEYDHDPFWTTIPPGQRGLVGCFGDDP